MANRGIAPPDPNTDIGRFRLAAGDSAYVALTPPEAGYGSYSIWSDAEIQTFLAVTGGSVPRAIAIGYRQMAAAVSAAAIKTDDLSINADKEVQKWITLAAYWDGIADKDDANAVDDYFDIVPIGGECYRPAEASPWNVTKWPSRGCW